VRLSIFWRIVLTSLLIIVVMAAVNFYALFQLRQLSALSTTLASQHYPAIEQAKHLQAVAFNQLNSEKKYLAVRDPTFLQHFDEEVEEFHRGVENFSSSRRGAISKTASPCFMPNWKMPQARRLPCRPTMRAAAMK
jgi:two-component system sensor histidine kinase GlrK